MLKSVLFAVVLSVVSAANMASATERTWVGGAYGSITNSACWDPAGNPSQNYKDVWVFTNSAAVSTADKNYNIYCAGIKVRNDSTVCFTKGVSICISKSNCPTGTFDVAEGSTLCFSNCVATIGSAALLKTGKGTVRFRHRCGYSSASGSNPFRPLIAAEGLVRLDPTGESGTHGFYGDLVIRDGAEVTVENISTLGDYANGVTVDEGGILRLYQSAAVDTLSGAGQVIGSGKTLTVRLKDDCAFAGTLEKVAVTLTSTATHTFTVGASNTLAEVAASFNTAGGLLRFAPGIGEFWIKFLSGSAGAVLPTEDADGRPIRVHAGFNAAADFNTLSVTGSGDLLVKGAAIVAKGNVVANTGAVGVEGDSLAFGDGTQGNDFDFSAAGSIQGLNGAALVFNNAASSEISAGVEATGLMTVTGPTAFAGDVLVRNGYLTVNGASSFAGKTTVLPGTTSEQAQKMLTVNAECDFADLQMGNGWVSIYADTEINGGDSAVNRITLKDAVLTIGKGAKVRGSRNTSYMNQYQSIFTRPRNQGVYFIFGDGASADTMLDIDGGFLSIGNGDAEPVMGPVSVRNGGELYIVRNFSARAGCAKTLSVDGGTLTYSYARQPYQGNVGSSSAPWRMFVGEAGGRLATDFVSTYGTAAKIELYVSAEPAVGVSTDGGFSYEIPTLMNLHRAQDLRGPVSIRDGHVFVLSDAYTNGKGEAVTTPLGTGNLEIGNAWLVLASGDASCTADLASGEGSVLKVSGAAVLSLRDSSSATAQSALIGPSGADGCPIVRTPGGALMLRERGSDLSFDGTHGTVKVNGSVPSAADGRVKLPVFTVQNTPDMYGELLRFDFAKYDADKGLVRFSDYVAGVSGGANTTAFVDGREATRTLTVEESARIAALNVIGNASGNFIPLTIAEDVVLSVGGGVAGETACVLINVQQTYGSGSIGGKGTIDFGASEGVFGVGIGNSYAYAPTVSAKIAGSGGVTFVGLPTETYPYLTVSGDNAYTGGTFVNAIQVRVGHANALGKGVVRVGDGMLAGGQVAFTKALTVANDFSIAGNGIKWSGSPDGGALWFCAPVTLTGDVEIRDSARISSRGQEATSVGTFQGVISGGALQIISCAAPMVFEGANTYAGGTEIVKSTLILRGPCSAGTGVITLDDATLRFENTAPVTFTNDLDGVGTIEIAGTAPVTFTGKGLENLPPALRTLGPGSSVDFPACANCTVAIGSDGLDLGGADLSLAALRGAGRVFNGTLAVTGEIQPGGVGAIGTLTFAAGVLTATGATFVCETDEAGADRIVIENPFDLSGLSLRTVRIGAFRDSASILTATELSGEFAATEFARKTQRIDYTATDAVLSAGGLLMIVR